MKRQPIVQISHEEMVRKYPLTGLVEGWYFRREQVSLGCWVVEGSDVFGRKVSRHEVGDHRPAMADCISLARQLVQLEKRTRA